MPFAVTSTRSFSFSNRVPDFPFQSEFPMPATGSHQGGAIYIVDEDTRTRAALSELLVSRGRKVVTFGSATEFQAYRRNDEAACLILDMRLPDMRGLELQKRLADECCPPVIFISGLIDVPGVVRAMKAGAIEFLTKPVNEHALEAAIDLAFTQDRRHRQQRLELATLRGRYKTLTPREREVLPLIAEGLLNKQAAAILGIREVTLQVHRCQVMKKMAAKSFADLVRMAHKLGIPVSA